ncbi:pyridoxal phosphate-dependent decarboxylase family protein [Amycolatopsis sp. CA-230715]|uniref:pyridoxal phosphate-dependent decarboxylase family protein n=1 Tax=Amycolatopsis sp. CA-230715 TaxID=2745196 RepID=UPI001C00F487|nr:pyridoxal-dependent decarboxylase [Amycolatopsis sp. CA-230715]QWF76835.1 L-2,4-diaminobutyrate decarboxylase [Amycolatopsis sp. CA-230715]
MADSTPDAGSLAGGAAGHRRLAELIPVALRAFAEGTAERGGPAPAGGPAAVAASLAADAPMLPREGVGAVRALDGLGRLLAAGSVDPAEPWCAAHLHCPPLAVAVAADVVASAVNPSMDSWDQAPVASEIEREFTAGVAALCYPDAASPDAVVTTGGTESNLLGLLLAREREPGVVPVCGRNAHHSVARAAWLLGLPAPLVVDCAGDRLPPGALDTALSGLPGPAVVVATAGTTNTGEIDPLPAIAEVCGARGARLHIDAAYGGMALCSPRFRHLVDGLDRADSVALDLHKFGWQPISAGLFAAREGADLGALTVRAEYLNPADDTEAGLPDLLGRSIRTSRRPDAFRMAVTLRALGTDGMGALVAHCVDTAAAVADAIGEHPALRLWGAPTLSTVLFRPVAADELGDELVAGVRRALLEAGTAVVGRAALPPKEGGPERLWLKLTLLHPGVTPVDYAPLLDLIAAAAASQETGIRAGQSTVGS